MALICLAADKGSPGVTTTAHALARVWPRTVILAETDPAGGDLVYVLTADGRNPLDPATGLISLAAEAAAPTPDDVARHTQRTHGGLTVLLGLPGLRQGQALAPMWGSLGLALANIPGTDVVVDCGRLPGADEAASVALLSHAEVILLLARQDAAGVAHARDRAAALHASWPPGGAPALAVAIVADPQGHDRIAAEARKLFDGWQIPIALVTTIADDPAGARRLADHLAVDRLRRRRTDPLLIRSARRLSAEIAGMLYAAAEAMP